MVVVLPLEEFCSLFCKVSQKLQKAKGFNHVWFTNTKLPIIFMTWFQPIYLILCYISFYFLHTVSETNFILGIRSNFSYKRGWRIGFCLLFFPKLFFHICWPTWQKESNNANLSLFLRVVYQKYNACRLLYWSKNGGGCYQNFSGVSK